MSAGVIDGVLRDAHLDIAWEIYSYGVAFACLRTEGVVVFMRDIHVAFGFRCMMIAVMVQMSQGLLQCFVYRRTLSQVMQVVTSLVLVS